MPITSAPFGVTSSGEPVTAYTLTNRHGCSAVILDFGCTIHALTVPDRDGAPTDVVLGYDSVQDYERGSCYYGAFVGQYANRIKGSRFPLCGKEVVLTPNERGNHLHGCFSFVRYDASIQGDSLVFHRVSPDGEDGYPGAVALTVTYTLTEDNGLVLDYRAVTDAPTVLNLTNHSYFNLSGHASGSAEDTVVQLNASRITEMDAESIPTGVIREVSGTAFDFTVPKPIGQDIAADDEQLRFGGGYDHNFILDLPSLETPVVTAQSPRTGILMDVYTTQPAVQFYTGNFVQDDPAAQCGKGGASYVQRGGFCLETQRYPDSPNRPEFPSTTLLPGEVYHEVTEYRFSTTE